MKRNKKFVIEASFIEAASILKLTLNEFLLLVYFDNSDECLLNFEVISKSLKIDLESIMEAFNSLLSKNIITLVNEKNEMGKRIDKISLDNVYKVIEESLKKEEKGKVKEDIFSTFEKEFGRPLRGMEFEVIKTWLDKMYSEELILAALKEAIYNGVTNIRYIDTVLYEWNKKGFTSTQDVDNYLKNKYNDKKLEETNIFEYNWLEDNDK